MSDEPHHDGPAKAKDLHSSTLFRAEPMQKRLQDAWYILSAKDHLLDPDRKIARYEQTLNDARAAERRKWSDEVFACLQRCTSPDDKIIIVAGEKYCQYLVPLIEERGDKVLRRTKGYSMGRFPGRLRQPMSQEDLKLQLMHYASCDRFCPAVFPL